MIERLSLNRLLAIAVLGGVAGLAGAQQAEQETVPAGAGDAAATAADSSASSSADASADAAAAAAALEPAVNVSDTPRVAQAPARAPGASSGVVDRLDLGTTSITGNQELPKVLYIVPWKRSDLGNLVGRPVNTLLDEVLAPVDPEVFERHLDYYDTLYGEREQE